MAASLIRRIGTPRALAKLKPTHPLPKCFGSFMMLPLLTGAGKPIDAMSNLHPRALSLSFAISCSGLMRGPDANTRSSRSDMSSFTRVPPISTTRTFLFMSDRRFRRQWLSAAPDQSLQDALRFRFWCGAGRPAFHNFKREESEQRQTSRFQIESQILRNLLDGPDAIELRCKLRLVGGQFQFLNAFEPVFRVSGNRCWIEAYVLIEILNETQGFQGPVVHVWRPRHIGSIAQQIGILLKHDPYAGRHPKLGEKSLPVILHQLHRWLAVYRFFAGKSKEKRGSSFSLLIARPVNNHHVDVGENGRRLRAIKVWVASCDKNDLAVPRQKVDRLLIPKCPQRACQLLFRDRLKRAVQRK